MLSANNVMLEKTKKDSIKKKKKKDYIITLPTLKRQRTRTFRDCESGMIARYPRGRIFIRSHDCMH